MSLQILQHLLRLLSFLNVARAQCHRVLTLGGVGGQRGSRLVTNSEVHLVEFADVPVAHFVEINVAHVIAIHIAHLLAVLRDLSLHVVLRFAPHRARLIISDQAVLLVHEGELAEQLVTHRAHEDIVEQVSSVVHADFAAILKHNFLVAF